MFSQFQNGNPTRETAGLRDNFDNAVEMVESWMDTSFAPTQFMLEPLCIVIIVNVALAVGTVCCGRCNTAVYYCCIPKAVQKRFEKPDN